jgi:hypothetical protein
MEASEQLRTLVNGFRVSQALRVAAVFGVSALCAEMGGSIGQRRLSDVDALASRCMPTG